MVVGLLLRMDVEKDRAAENPGQAAHQMHPVWLAEMAAVALGFLQEDACRSSAEMAFAEAERAAPLEQVGALVGSATAPSLALFVAVLQALARTDQMVADTP